MKKRGAPPVKKFIVVLCAVVSFAASAEWVLVSKNELGTSLYIDPNIKIKGNLRMFWHMQDLSNADTQGDMSYRGIWQYDCSEKLQRNMQVAAFKQPMAVGQKSDEAYQPSDWVMIGNDASSQAMLTFVCSR
jgi:hypothetical protein